MTVEAWVLWEAGGRYPNIITGGGWSPGGFMIFVAVGSHAYWAARVLTLLRRNTWRTPK